MELVCPVCNGIDKLNINCPHCTSATEDCGILKNFLGPYSPYEESKPDLFTNQLDLETGNCMHLVSCPNCGEDTRVPVGKVIV
jgi:hypothetical protein